MAFNTFSFNIFLGFCEYGNSRPGRGYSKIFLPKPFEDQRRTDRIYSVCSIQFPTGNGKCYEKYNSMLNVMFYVKPGLFLSKIQVKPHILVCENMRIHIT